MQHDFTGKKVAILGFGVNNAELVPLLQSRGAAVTICDKKEELAQDIPGVTYQLGENYLANLTDFDVLFRTPALPYLSSEIQAAIQAGVVVTSQTELFMHECPAPIIGVTGTKGKGTTSSLIEACLLEAKERGEINGDVYLAGNIGVSPLSFLDQLTENDWVILELSSFQLQGINVSPHIAVVTNLGIDHLDHHKDVAEYHEAKKNIVKHQKFDDFAIVNADDRAAFSFLTYTSAEPRFFASVSIGDGAYVENNSVMLCMYDEVNIPICTSDEIHLVGHHNLMNIAAATVAARLAGASIDAIRDGVKAFKGLPHRLQLAGEVSGIRYYNDSFATTPEATIAAIHSFTQPITLIAGGSSKGADFTELAAHLAKSTAKTVVYIGDEGEKIKESLEQYPKITCIPGGTTMPQIIKTATEATEAGGIVLLSPACASFGLFKDYKDRGNQFMEAVKHLN